MTDHRGKRIIAILFIIALTTIPLSITLSERVNVITFVFNVAGAVHPSFWVGMVAFALLFIALLEYSKGYQMGRRKLVVLCLSVALLGSIFADLLYRVIVVNPLSGEVYHWATIPHIVRRGNVNPPFYPGYSGAGHPATVAPGIFGAIFAMITSTGTLPISSYLPFLFFPLLFSLFTYVAARKLGLSEPACMLATVFAVALQLSIVDMSRSTFTLPLYVLTFVPLLGLMKGQKKSGYVVAILLLFSAFALSDPGLMILLPALILVPLAAWLIGERKAFPESLSFLRLGLILAVMFLAWGIYRYPGPIWTLISSAARMKDFVINMLISPSAAQYPSFAGIYSPAYSMIYAARGIITGAGIFLALSLSAYVFLCKRSALSRFEVREFALLLAFFLPNVALILVGMNRRWLPVWVSLLTVFIVFKVLARKLGSEVKNWKLKAHKILRYGTVAFIVAVFLANPIIVWSFGPKGLSDSEKAEFTRLSQSVARNPILAVTPYTLAWEPGSLVRYVFSDRKNISIRELRYEDGDVILENLKYQWIIITDHSRTLDAMYELNPPALERVDKFMNTYGSVEYDLLYSASHYSRIFRKKQSSYGLD